MKKERELQEPEVVKKGSRVRMREEKISAGKRIAKERLNKIKCIICAVACFIAVLLTVIDAVAPQKYNVSAGQIATSNIVAIKDVIDQDNYKAAREAAKNSVSAIYKKDDAKRVNVINKINAGFNKLTDARRQAIEQRNQWLEQNVGSTIDDHHFDTSYINMLIGNLGITCSEKELLVIINTPIQDIESIAAATIREINAVMEQGLAMEDLISQRSKIISTITGENGAFASVSKELRAITKRIIENSLEANYFVDDEATEAARKEAENTVDQANYRYNKGDILVLAGGRITASHINMMREMGMLDDGSLDLDLYIGVGFMVLTVLFMMALYIVVYEPKMIQSPKKVLMLVILIVLSVIYSAVIFKLQPGLAQIAISTILIAVLLKPRVALVANMAISVILGIIVTQNTQLASTQCAATIVISLVSGTASVFMCKGTMHRMRIMATGLIIGGVGAFTSIFMGLIFTSDLSTIFLNSLWPLISGIISAVLCVGTLPVWEAVFGILTPTKLLEITNPNQPLLRRLAIEAPGTHHHSIVVANLAETGAQAIGADTMLVRAGAYYHDVGKLASPEAFTENQSEKQKNFHSMMLPGESAAIIKAHPTEGNELATKYKLPKEIRDIILEHHGTTVVGYFYAKALEMFEKVNRSDFAYPGPKPHSKETAIIMLADSCEAAVRSLPDKSSENVRKKIDQIISDRINDGQFDECDITMGELNRIAAEFTQALSGVHHQRIEYPDLQKAIEDNKEKAKEQDED